jgi:REP element-mobilizing transposase RayT
MTDKSYPQRKSPRLKGYDYRQEGAYFVTLCTAKREHLFGDVVEGRMQLNPLGMIAHQELQHISERWQVVALDLFVVMPNHVHAIIALVGVAFLPDAEKEKPDAKNSVPTLGHVVGSYKAGVTRIARQHGILDETSSIWQERYHDNIIRDERSLDYIRQYVMENPARWEDDVFYGDT